MEVSISSRNRDLSPALRALATEKVGRLARFLDGLDHAEVHFFEERNPRIVEREVCEVTIRGRRQLVRAKACAADAAAAVEQVVDKLEHQLHKAKTKRARRSHPRKLEPLTGAETGPEEEEGDANRINIVKTKQFAIKPMTPEEAALQMELLAHGFYFFTNCETQRAAVVYRRRDGDVGLIEASA